MKRLILLLLCATLCRATSVTIAESTYADASGRLATGTVTISWPSFSNGTSNIAAGSTTVVVTAGVLSVSLVANDTADPPFNYTASFRLQTSSYSQQWKVPTVAGPLTIQGVTWSSNSPVTVGLDQIRRTGHVAGDIAYYDGILWKRLARGTNGQVLTIDTSLSGYLKWATGGGGGGTWGGIGGTLSDQTDLSTALALKLAKASNLSDIASASTARTNLGLGTAAVAATTDFAAAVHVHAAADVTSGVFNIARLATGTPTGLKFVRDDGTLATPSGSGNMAMTSGATDPSSSCTPGTDQYFQTVSIDIWFCGSSGTWKKFLSTLNTGSFVNVGLAGTVPSTPASGYVSEYFDSTAKVPQAVDDTGAKSTMVRPLAAVTSNWLRSISTVGVPTASQPAFSDISGTASTAQIADNAVTSAKLAVVNTRHTACVTFGSKNASSALADTDLADSALFEINAPSTLVQITVRADTATPNIILGRDRAGSVVNLTSSALATASSGGIACSKTSAVTGINGVTTCSATLQNVSLNQGDWIVPVSGTAGGTAKQMTACFTTTVD